MRCIYRFGTPAPFPLLLAVTLQKCIVDSWLILCFFSGSVVSLLLPLPAFDSVVRLEKPAQSAIEFLEYPLKNGGFPLRNSDLVCGRAA
jgi:hypothetical protein